VIYNRAIPRINNIRWLTRLAMPFPATAGDIAAVATAWRFDKATLEFLALFPEDVVFNSREDFLTRVEELELLLQEEAQAPAEAALSSQD
jgi:hypothetical protein